MTEVRWITAFLDSPSREAEPFWLAVTGTTMSARRDGGTFATLLPADGDAFLRVQVVGSGPPRGHLDLHVTDVPSAAGEAVGLGAHEVRREDGLVVLRSPAGVAFCLVAWHGEAIAPPSGLVDQLSLDVPAGRFEAEAQFWTALTGGALPRAAGWPVRLVPQPIGSGAPGVHLHFACDDVDAEVDRHVALGARVVRRVAGDRATLRDPVGRDYCVTARPPAA